MTRPAPLRPRALARQPLIQVPIAGTGIQWSDPSNRPGGHSVSLQIFEISTGVPRFHRANMNPGPPAAARSVWLRRAVVARAWIVTGTSSLPGGKRCKKLHLIPMTQETAQSNPIMMELYYSCSGRNQYKMRRPVWPSHARAGGDSRPGGSITSIQVNIDSSLHAAGLARALGHGSRCTLYLATSLAISRKHLIWQAHESSGLCY
jgi:hypothetical protein